MRGRAGGADAAGVVLVGGRSSRMGTAKAGLEWHGSTLLFRTASVLARAVGGPVVAVAAPGQEVLALPDGVELVRDPVPGRGPMQGLATGLDAVRDRAAVAFVCATDLPFLHPAFVRRVLALLPATGAEVVVPFAGGFRQPLAAGYRTALAPVLARLVADGEPRLGRLPEHCAVQVVDEPALLDDAELARCDPRLDSVTNVNTPAEYAAARARPAPEITVQVLAPALGSAPGCGPGLAVDPLLDLAVGPALGPAPSSASGPTSGSAPGPGSSGPWQVRAATLGRAAAAVGVVIDGPVSAVLNGLPVRTDVHLALVTGDHLALSPGSPPNRR